MKDAKLKELVDNVEKEMADEEIKINQIGSLNREYKAHVLMAYNISQQLHDLGYERPWIIVKETVEAGGPNELTKFAVETEKKLRLEIR